METIFRWLARMLAGILERYADPDLEARLRAYNERVVAQEQKIREAEDAARVSEAAYQTSVNRRKEIDRLLEISHQQEDAAEQVLVESRERVKQIEIENQKESDFC